MLVCRDTVFGITSKTRIFCCYFFHLDKNSVTGPIHFDGDPDHICVHLCDGHFRAMFTALAHGNHESRTMGARNSFRARQRRIFYWIQLFWSFCTSDWTVEMWCCSYGYCGNFGHLRQYPCAVAHIYLRRYCGRKMIAPSRLISCCFFRPQSPRSKVAHQWKAVLSTTSRFFSLHGK